jgi:hypothetical protein
MNCVVVCRVTSCLTPVARGFIPVRLRSSGRRFEILGPLRDPTGINPLTTGLIVSMKDRCLAN